MTASIVITILPNTVGVYGIDATGTHWSSWSRANGEPLPCGLCSAPITSGYARSMRHPDGPMVVCPEHVELRREARRDR